MFAPLPPHVIERLASNLIRVDVPAGRTVIRQGGPGDRFYVVAQGELAVIVGPRMVRVLGPGDSFGEIALLKAVPRTATVTARSQASLYALERGVFLEAVTGHRVSAEVAHAVIRTRLGGSGKPDAPGGKGVRS
jgi:CRP-like cAMP-binding protein